MLCNAVEELLYLVRHAEDIPRSDRWWFIHRELHSAAGRPPEQMHHQRLFRVRKHIDGRWWCQAER